MWRFVVGRPEQRSLFQINADGFLERRTGDADDAPAGSRTTESRPPQTPALAFQGTADGREYVVGGFGSLPPQLLAGRCGTRCDVLSGCQLEDATLLHAESPHVKGLRFRCRPFQFHSRVLEGGQRAGLRQNSPRSHGSVCWRCSTASAPSAASGDGEPRVRRAGQRLPTTCRLAVRPTSSRYRQPRQLRQALRMCPAGCPLPRQAPVEFHPPRK